MLRHPVVCCDEEIRESGNVTRANVMEAQRPLHICVISFVRKLEHCTSTFAIFMNSMH